MEEEMSMKWMFAAAAFGVALSSAPAGAYERYYDFGQVWGESVDEHRRDEALSASPRDTMRHQPRQVFGGRPHDPSGNIVLEGAR
jgi:hypothetical protein